MRNIGFLLIGLSAAAVAALRLEHIVCHADWTEPQAFANRAAAYVFASVACMCGAIAMRRANAADGV